MAIAAAGTTPVRRRRRVHPVVWVLVPLVVVALVVAGVIVARSPSSSGRRGASSQVVRTSSPAGHHRGHRRSHGRSHAALAARARDPFTASLKRWLHHRTGDITAAVEDLHSRRTWVYRPGHPEHTASIVKVQILATLLHQEQSEGALSDEDQDLATGMIEQSSDDDATDLWNAVGGSSAVQAFDDDAGLHHTTTNVAWGLTTTTPTDQLQLLRTVLFKNQLLTRASRAYEYGLMRRIIPFDTWGVTEGPDHHAKVAFKNGWLPYDGSWQVNSIGSVRGDGRHYLIAVMTDGSPTESYGIDTIERISQNAWHDLDAGGS